MSKQTVKNKLHKLTFPQQKETKPEKKAVEYLYIDADEDHVSLLFKEKKGDLEVKENNWKNNCVLAKLVYVYEGIEPESPKSKRHRLVNPHYFSGVYDGADNAKLWDEVYAYLDSHYDLKKVKKIYLNADGGTWIQSGKKRIAGITSVLDEFHLQKYLLKMTGHMKDSADDARKELCDAIKSETYILSNWTAAKIRLKDRETIKGCSAEGHVSHVLSSRMSSSPMGWSRTGVDKMAHLRAYYWNGGNMLELVRQQERELPAAAGAEKEVLSCEGMLRWERQHHNKLGKYIESISHSVSTEVKKYAWFHAHIWGL